MQSPLHPGDTLILQLTASVLFESRQDFKFSPNNWHFRLEVSSSPVLCRVSKCQRCYGNVSNLQDPDNNVCLFEEKFHKADTASIRCGLALASSPRHFLKLLFFLFFFFFFISFLFFVFLVFFFHHVFWPLLNHVQSPPSNHIAPFQCWSWNGKCDPVGLSFPAAAQSPLVFPLFKFPFPSLLFHHYPFHSHPLALLHFTLSPPSLPLGGCVPAALRLVSVLGGRHDRTITDN